MGLEVAWNVICCNYDFFLRYLIADLLVFQHGIIVAIV